MRLLLLMIAAKIAANHSDRKCMGCDLRSCRSTGSGRMGTQECSCALVKTSCRVVG